MAPAVMPRVRARWKIRKNRRAGEDGDEPGLVVVASTARSPGRAPPVPSDPDFVEALSPTVGKGSLRCQQGDAKISAAVPLDQGGSQKAGLGVPAAVEEAHRHLDGQCP